MKIDPSKIENARIDSTNAAAAGKAAEKPSRTSNVDKQDASGRAVDSTSQSKPTEKVQLSNLLSNLRSLALSGEEEISPERKAHLDKLAAQVASGEYHVDSKKLSARIIDDTLKGIG